MGSLYLRGQTWWAKWYIDGRPSRRSCATAVKREAKAKLAQWEEKALRGEDASPTLDRVRFEELAAGVIADYRTNGKRSLAKVEDGFLHLEKVFAHRRVVTLTTPDVQAYIETRQREGAANATINRELAILKRGFTLLLRAGLVTRKPYIPMLREENVRQGFIGPLEALALREALPEYLRPVFDFLLTVGWRKQEALTLPWANVNMTEGTVRLSPAHSKNSEGRLVYLTASLRETFRTLWAETLERARRQDPECSPRRAAEMYPSVFTRQGHPIKNFRGAWARACRQAGVPGLLVHDLRRSAVRNLLRSGASETVAMQITGHKTASVFRRYDITSEQDLMEAAKRLEGANPVPTGTILGTIQAQEGVRHI